LTWGWGEIGQTRVHTGKRGTERGPLLGDSFISNKSTDPTASILALARTVRSGGGERAAGWNTSFRLVLDISNNTTGREKKKVAYCIRGSGLGDKIRRAKRLAVQQAGSNAKFAGWHQLEGKEDIEDRRSVGKQ